MRPRTLGLLCLLAVGGSLSCLAQQPTGPATLENLLGPDEAQKPADAAAAEPPDTGPKQPAGTIARPADGVEHPDLDKAWADYEAAVAKVTEFIKAAIAKQFDAATAKGDLDAAEKWQTTLEKFENAGEMPAAKEMKTAVAAALTDYRKAREELIKAYESVVTALTMEKKIGEAKAVREESQIVARNPPHEQKEATVKDAKANAVFLTDLLARDVSVHHGLRIGGDNGYGGRVSVLGKASPKAISMHPFAGGMASASFDVPAGCTHFEATAAIDDRARGQQRTPLTFKVYADSREIWKSRPLWANGPTSTCRVAIKGTKTITLVIECPGADNAAWAVWCDPQFLTR